MKTRYTMKELMATDFGLPKQEPWTKEQWEALPKTWKEIIAIEPEIGELFKRFKKAVKQKETMNEWSVYIDFRGGEIYHPGQKGIDDLVGMLAPAGSRLYHPDGVCVKTCPYDIVTDKFMKVIGYA